MAAQNRVEALLQAKDERGQRRWSAEDLKALAVYVDAMNGVGDAAILQKTAPPPPALLASLLALLKELELHKSNDVGSSAAAQLGAALSKTVQAPSRVSIATSPMFIRSSKS